MKRQLLKSITPIIHPITDIVLERYYKGDLYTTELTEERALLLAPHVDDETIGAGGTLRKYANQGADTTVIFLTNGAGSVSDLEESELVKRRREEAYKAQELIGFQDVRFFDAPDGELESTDAFQQQLIDIIDEKQPEVIYAPVFVDCHGDHIETAHLLRDTLAKLENPRMVVRLYEINTTLPKEEINCVIDITSTFEQKEQAVSVFTSQAIDFDGFLALARYKSQLVQQPKVEAVETFWQGSPAVFMERFDAVYGKWTYSDYFKQVNKSSTLLYAIFKNANFKQKVYEATRKGGHIE